MISHLESVLMKLIYLVPMFDKTRNCIGICVIVSRREKHYVNYKVILEITF